MDKLTEQAILARDIIDMIQRYSDDVDVLEYLEGITFSIARIIDNGEVVNWDDIAGVCDQRYHSLTQVSPVPLDIKLLERNKNQLGKYLP